MRRSRKLGPSSSARLALVALLVAASCLPVFGCSAQAHVIPSALDTSAIDVKAEPGPARVPDVSAGVPAGQVLEATHWIARSKGRELHSMQWWDFEHQRFRSDFYGDPASAEGGPTTTATTAETATILFADVRADGRHVSYDAFSGELRNDPAASERSTNDIQAEWGSDDGVLLGRQQLAGRAVDVYRVDLNIPEGQERSADFGLIYVDHATGMRVREEWLLGSPGDAWVYHLREFRLVSHTPALDARLTTQSLLDLAAAAVAQKLAGLAKLAFPVWGLPDGAHGLVLAGVTVLHGKTGEAVRLSYVPKGEIGPALVTVETNRAASGGGLPEGVSELETSSTQAPATAPGTARHIDLGPGGYRGGNQRVGDTTVRVLLSQEAAKLGRSLEVGALAGELIDIRGLASAAGLTRSL